MRPGADDPVLSLSLSRLAAILFGLGAVVPRAARGDEPLGLWPLRVEEHRPGGAIAALAQTPDGLIWIAGEAGLQRFDGRRFVKLGGVVTPPGVSAVAADEAGRLWFAQPGQGVRRLERTGETTRFDQGLPKEIIIALEPGRGGALWAISRSAAAVLPPGAARFHSVALPGVARIHGVVRSRTGGIWLETSIGFVRLDEPPVLPRAVDGARPHGEARLRILADLSLDREGREAFARVQRAGTWIASDVRRLLQDRRGDVWIATGHGLHLVTREGIVSVGARDGLPDDQADALWEDREGNVWAITHGGGLAVLSRLPVARLGAREGLRGNSPFALAETPDGTIWVTTTDGLSSVRGGKPTFHGNGGLGQFRALTATSGGALWIGTTGPRVVRYDPAIHRFTPFDLPGAAPATALRVLLPDGEGLLAAGTDGSLRHLAPNGSWTVVKGADPACTAFLDPDAGRCPTQIVAIEPRRGGGLWLGTAMAGLRVLGAAGIGSDPARDGALRLWGLHETADGTLWAATEEGLFRRREGSFVREERVPAMPLFGVSSDGAGVLWMGGLRGLVRLPAASPGGVASIFTAQDGAPSDELMPGFGTNVLRDRTGHVWLATVAGLAVGNPAALEKAPAPTPFFDEVQANGVSFGFPLPPLLELPPGRGDLAASYGAAAFASPHRVRFYYHLDGYDDHWVSAGERPIAHYTNLRPGRYVLRLRASEVGAPERGSEATVEVRLRPWFHQRPIFIVLVMSLVTGLVFVVIGLRGRSLRARFAAVLAERHRIARDLHDTLAQVFAGLGFQIDNVVAGHRARRLPVVPELEHLRRMVGQGRRAARVVVWNLRAGTGEPGSIVRGLEELTGLYEGARVCLRVAGAPWALPIGVETELLYVAQQAVSNAIEHAGAREIGIDLEFAPDRFDMWIRDDGKGFDMGAAGGASGHYGLAGMRERAARARGTLVIESVPGVGTEIGVSVARTALMKEREA